MREKLVKNTMMAVLMMLFTASTLMASNMEKKLVGTWKYQAPDAPYEYSEGQFVFTKKDGKLHGTAKVNYSQVDLEDLKVKGEKVTFTVYVEGEYVEIELELKGNKLTGAASYSEGTLDITAEKEKE